MAYFDAAYFDAAYFDTDEVIEVPTLRKPTRKRRRDYDYGSQTYYSARPGGANPSR